MITSQNDDLFASGRLLRELQLEHKIGLAKLMSQRQKMITAKSYIREAQLAGRLFCVSKDDLLAPFRERERENHQEFCAMLTEQFDIGLSLRDFCTEDKDESGPIFSIQPLQMAEVQNQNRLMVITCTYQLGEKKKKDDAYSRLLLQVWPFT